MEAWEQVYFSIVISQQKKSIEIYMTKSLQTTFSICFLDTNYDPVHDLPEVASRIDD